MKNLTKVIFVIIAAALVFSGLNPLIFAADPETIKIGYIAPFIGPAAELGNNGLKGILLALQDINEKGIKIGDTSYKIQIIKYDSGCMPQKGVTGMLKMVTEDKVVAILGGHCDGVCKAVAKLSDKFEIPGITIECAEDSITKPGHEFYFRMRPPVSLIVPLFTPKLFRTFAPRTAAFLVIDDDYGHRYLESVAHELNWHDVRIVAKETFKRGTNDFAVQLTKIKESNADLLFYVGTASEGAVILKQAKEMGMMRRTKFIGSAEMGEMEILLRAGPEALDGTYAISLWGKVPPEFENRIRKTFNKPMHYGMIFGYDALHVLANAIERAQSLDPVQIKDALKETNYRGLEGRITFKEFIVEGYKNQGKFTPSMIRWENGKRVHLDIFLDWEN